MGSLRCKTYTRPLPAGAKLIRRVGPVGGEMEGRRPDTHGARGAGAYFERDLQAAGIPKVDQRGRVVDVHALRHTFGTYLSKAGVAPRTAQAAMRHSKIDLTMNVYTDPRLLDVAGAIERLPDLPLSQQVDAATGTDGPAEKLPPNPDNPCEFVAFPTIPQRMMRSFQEPKNPIFPRKTRLFQGLAPVGDDGLEPPTSAL